MRQTDVLTTRILRTSNELMRVFPERPQHVTPGHREGKGLEFSVEHRAIAEEASTCLSRFLKISVILVKKKFKA